MEKLNQHLEEWLSADLLSADQVKNILHYEQAKPERHWILYGILCVGVTVLAIGIISLIAANWVEIPKLAKLAGNFVALA